ncbi:hypothetical protein COX18_02875, partial [Candidatus Desantisbacteria bacterium CG23_combo_of_CG06-09_8_20_14_all_40_23]
NSSMLASHALPAKRLSDSWCITYFFLAPLRQDRILGYKINAKMRIAAKKQLTKHKQNGMIICVIFTLSINHNIRR